MQIDRSSILTTLSALVAEPGFVYALCDIIWHDLFYKASESAKVNWRSRLNIQELNYLVGILIKGPINLQIPSPETLSSQVARTRNLLEQLQASYLQPKNPSPKTLQDALPTLTDVATEAIFYDHAGAYDFQHWEYAPRKYALDADWLAVRRDISVSNCVLMAQAIKRLVEVKRSRAPVSDHDERCQQLLETFCFRTLEIASIMEQRDYPPILKAFSCEPGTVNGGFYLPGSYNVADSHPLIRLAADRFFLPIPFSLTTSISESPFYWMLQDDAYRPTAEKNRGRTTNDLALELLRTVFPSVEPNVQIKRNKQATETDIDGLISHRTKGVIVQAKSKRLTALAKTGDERALRDDFAAAIQEAYDQGTTSRNSLLGNTGALEREDGTSLSWPPCDDYFIICVTSDYYPGLAHQLFTFLRKRDEDPWPVVVSLADLEILAFYLDTPSIFLHYLHQRAKYGDSINADNEIIYLANYLRYRLYLPPPYNWMALDPSEAQYIDGHYPVMRGLRYSPFFRQKNVDLKVDRCR